MAKSEIKTNSIASQMPITLCIIGVLCYIVFRLNILSQEIRLLSKTRSENSIPPNIVKDKKKRALPIQNLFGNLKNSCSFQTKESDNKNNKEKNTSELHNDEENETIDTQHHGNLKTLQTEKEGNKHDFIQNRNDVSPSCVGPCDFLDELKLTTKNSFAAIDPQNEINEDGDDLVLEDN